MENGGGSSRRVSPRFSRAFLYVGDKRCIASRPGFVDFDRFRPTARALKKERKRAERKRGERGRREKEKERETASILADKTRARLLRGIKAGRDLPLTGVKRFNGTDKKAIASATTTTLLLSFSLSSAVQLRYEKFTCRSHSPSRCRFIPARSRLAEAVGNPSAIIETMSPF